METARRWQAGGGLFHCEDSRGVKRFHALKILSAGDCVLRSGERVVRGPIQGEAKGAVPTLVPCDPRPSQDTPPPWSLL